MTVRLTISLTISPCPPWNIWFQSLPAILTQLNTIQLIIHPLSVCKGCLQMLYDGRNTLFACKKCSLSPVIHLICELEINRREMNITNRVVVFKPCLQNLQSLRRCSLTTEVGEGRRRGSRPSHPSFNSSSTTFICFNIFGLS